MSNFDPGSYFIQEAMQVCVWFVFVVLAIAAHTAQSEEAAFPPTKNILTTKPVNPDIDWQPSYRLNTHVVLKSSEQTVPTGLGFSRTPQTFLAAEPKKEDEWSLNIQKQMPSGKDCSTSASLLCFDSKEERPADIKPLRDSFWVVWRKAFHF
jgi:hypothetical protein